MTTPTFRILDEDTIEVHAPGCAYFNSLSGDHLLFLDADHRVVLGWPDRTDTPGVYTLDTSNFEIVLSVYDMSYDKFNAAEINLPEISYMSSEKDTTEQVLNELTTCVTAALEWAEQGYPLPADCVELPGYGAVITEAVTTDGADHGIEAARGDDGLWYGRWTDESRKATDQLASFVHDGRRYIQDESSTYHNPRFREEKA